MATMRTLYCQNGDHYWQRPSQRGRQPLHCPEHPSKAEPEPASQYTEEDARAVGLDERARYERDAERRRATPVEQPIVEVLEPTPVSVSPRAARRSAESSPLWEQIAKLKAEYHCTCDIYPGMTLADLRQVKSCQDRWICNVLDTYRRRLAA